MHQNERDGQTSKQALRRFCSDIPSSTKISTSSTFLNFCQVPQGRSKLALRICKTDIVPFIRRWAKGQNFALRKAWLFVCLHQFFALNPRKSLSSRSLGFTCIL